MSNEKNKNEENVEQVSDESQSLEDQAIAEGECCNTGCGDACVAGKIGDDGEEEVVEPMDPLEAKTLEVEDLKHQLLLQQADFQNFKRRALNNIDVAREQQLISIAKTMVNVLDHFDMALSVDQEKTTVKAMFEGMEMARNEYIKTLSDIGVKKIDVNVGDELNPEKHQAVMHQESEEIDSNHITAELQAGYEIANKTLIRAVKVAVAQQLQPVMNRDFCYANV